VKLPVAINIRARRAWPAIAAITHALPGVLVIGDDGTTLRVRADGGVEEVLPGGHARPGIAGDPCATRSSP
jgi:hypothetical protein